MRLDELGREYGAAITISWRSFLLRPQPEPRSLELFRRYTESWRNPAAQPGAPRFRPWSTREAPPTHSVPANMAVKAAARQGAFEPYHLALMNEYFWENRNITATQTLIDVAAACGLDVDRFTADLHDAELEREVVRDHQEAVVRGITAVPTVVVDDEWQLPGAQDLAFYRRVVERRRALRVR